MKVVHASGVRISTLTGHIAVLKPGVPAELPELLAVLALGQGAKQVLEDGEAPAVIPVAAPKTVETRHDKLVRIMKDLIEIGDPTNFRQDGQPKSAVLNRLFGEAVLEDERAPAWDAASRKL